MTASLTDTVAAEVRAEMGRQQMSGRDLAARIGKSHAYVYRRLTSRETSLDMGDLQAIAEALGVPVSRFLPSGAAAS